MEIAFTLVYEVGNFDTCGEAWLSEQAWQAKFGISL